MSRTNYTEKEIARAALMLSRGLTLAQIAAKLGRKSKTYLGEILAAHGYGRRKNRSDAWKDYPASPYPEVEARILLYRELAAAGKPLSAGLPPLFEGER